MAVDSENKNMISLTKEVYGKNNASKILDEEFTEFVLKTQNYKEFFELYNSFFYDISEDIHKSFLHESTNYLDSPFVLEKQQVKNTLESQLVDLQNQIDSIERHHPYYKNSSVISNISNKPNNQTPMSGDRYLMQSGRKRLIGNDEIYNILKSRLKTTKPDSEFIIFIPEEGLNGIEDGPPITNNSEIFVENNVINTYTNPTNDGITATYG